MVWFGVDRSLFGGVRPVGERRAQPVLRVVVAGEQGAEPDPLGGFAV